MAKRTGIGLLGRVAAQGLALALATGSQRCLAAGDDPAREAEVSEYPRPELICASVFRVVPLLVRASAEVYSKRRDFFSCHNQAVPALALGLARKRGFAVDSRTLCTIAEHTEADLNGALDDYRKGRGQPEGVIRAGDALWALEATGWPADETTDAVVRYLNSLARFWDD
jgi:hypothetical protein